MLKRIIAILLRKIHIIFHGHFQWHDESNADYVDEQANDYIYNKLQDAYNSKTGFMIAKFGTIELNTIVCQYLINNKNIPYRAYINGEIDIFPSSTIKLLCMNAGFFPSDLILQKKYSDLCIEDMKYIDILASYITYEKYIEKEISNVKRVNLNGFYAPFLWKNPWTRFLKDKKVLVIHPFKDSIISQYNKREELFDNLDVLPEFKSLTVIKAVQSIGGNDMDYRFSNWFEALESMEMEIDKVDFDVAIIGCGAYGFNLAAYIKKKNKIAIHMAGWTQMLFGIYGNRWLTDQKGFSKFIKKSWVRPDESEKPKSSEKVENGCYW